MFATTGAAPAVTVSLALQAVHAHELAHFYIDAAVAQFELLSRHALWLPRKLQFVRHGAYDAYEETIANAAMLRAVRELRGTLRILGREKSLRTWTRMQPHGYNTGYRYTALHRFEHALNRHGSSMLFNSSLPAQVRRQIAFAPLVRMPMSAALGPVPLYYVFGSSSMRLGDIGIFPAIRIAHEAPQFQRRLNRLPMQTQRSYSRLKVRLAHASPTPGDRFQRWPPLGHNIWSLRLNKGDRLHLKHIQGVDFEAVDIGTHSDLGHD